MSRPFVRLMIVDCHDVIRRGVRSLFEARDQFRVVADAGDGCEALSLARRLKPNIMIVDYTLPGLNGADLLHAMKREGLDTKVVLYTMHDSPDIISIALQAGVRAYVLKSDPEAHLVEAVEAVSMGKPHLSPTVSDALLASFLEIEPPTVRGGLTHREREIVQLIAEGGLNKLIAHRLGVTIKTVETHRASAMRKLKIRTTAQLVRWAIRNNLVSA